MFKTEIPMAQALLDNRRFKDEEGNIYQRNDKTVDSFGFCCQTPFVVSIKEEGNYQWQDIKSHWDRHAELIELFEIPDLATDTKVLVSNHKDSSSWLPRHSRGWTNNGDIVTFDGGQTSHTTNPKSTTTNWKYWKIDEGKYEGRQNF